MEVWQGNQIVKFWQLIDVKKVKRAARREIKEAAGKGKERNERERREENGWGKVYGQSMCLIATEPQFKEPQ